MTDARLARPLWRGRTNVDALTISVIERAERALGRQLVITQGSYNAGAVKQSAGTHDRGGAVDISTRSLTEAQKQATILELRKAGMAAWIRRTLPGVWAEHIHGIVVDHPDLSSGAAAQVVAYRAGRNGLANHGQDDGPRLTPIPRPQWPAVVPKKRRPQKIREALKQLRGQLADPAAGPTQRKRIQRAIADLVKIGKR